MTEREEIIEQMAALSARKSRLAEKARLSEKIEPALAELYDAWHDAASDEIGRLQFRLHEIEAAASRKVLLWDAAYGRLL